MSDNPWQLAASKKPSTSAAQSAPQASQTTGVNAPQGQKPNNADPGTAGPGVATPPATSNGVSNGGLVNGNEEEDADSRLVFHFAPDMKPLILPEAETLLEGTDS
jgi:hypothetical protein